DLAATPTAFTGADCVPTLSTRPESKVEPQPSTIGHRLALLTETLPTACLSLAPMRDALGLAPPIVPRGGRTLPPVHRGGSVATQLEEAARVDAEEGSPSPEVKVTRSREQVTGPVSATKITRAGKQAAGGASADKDTT